MPVKFCCVCGCRHDISDKEASAGASDSRQAESSSKMSKGASKENIIYLKESVFTMLGGEQETNFTRDRRASLGK